MENNNKIFIQIASYRDPELLHTIKNCIENAKYPNNLVFAICWQHDNTENMNEFINDERFKIISINYKESKGCCWARNKVQQLYDDEEYTLQLDSHHRFVKDWDVILIELYKKLKLKCQKPLITTYLPSYNPENDPEDRILIPQKICFKEFTKDKQTLFIPSYIDDFNLLTEPINAIFYSAHFAFTSGDFVKDVPHDPQLYFTGEEMSITVRAYTYGYDLFHPHIVIAWHEYTRKYRVKHWDDDKEWWKKNLHSTQHYLTIFKDSNIGLPYGLGSNRTVEDYINFSNINFLDNINNVENINITIKEENDEINIYKIMDDSWRNWIKENIALNISIHEIKKKLLTANFSLDDINNELKIINC